MYEIKVFSGNAYPTLAQAVADYLGITEGTSKSNLSKAKLSMRGKITKLIEDTKINEREREERVLRLYKEADLERV